MWICEHHSKLHYLLDLPSFLHHCPLLLFMMDPPTQSDSPTLPLQCCPHWPELMATKNHILPVFSVQSLSGQSPSEMQNHQSVSDDNVLGPFKGLSSKTSSAKLKLCDGQQDGFRRLSEWVHIPASLFTCCVTLDKVFNCSVLQFN